MLTKWHSKANLIGTWYKGFHVKWAAPDLILKAGEVYVEFVTRRFVEILARFRGDLTRSGSSREADTLFVHY